MRLDSIKAMRRPDGHYTLAAVVSRCQALAGRLSEVSPAALLDDVRRLVDGLKPDALTPTEHVVLATVLAQTLSHVARQAGIDRQTAVARAFMDLAAESPLGDTWWNRWSRALDGCGAALGADASVDQSHVATTRTGPLLQVIARRYRESTLRLNDIAKDVRMSPWYASRVLRQATGDGFVGHLRLARVRAAEQLLTTTALSVKEIAADVGYQTSRQFILNFKRVHRLTPTAYRCHASHLRGGPTRSIPSLLQPATTRKQHK